MSFNFVTSGGLICGSLISPVSLVSLPRLYVPGPYFCEMYADNYHYIEEKYGPGTYNLGRETRLTGEISDPHINPPEVTKLNDIYDNQFPTTEPTRHRSKEGEATGSLDTGEKATGYSSTEPTWYRSKEGDATGSLDTGNLALS